MEEEHRLDIMREKAGSKVLVYDIGGTWSRAVGIHDGKVIGILKEAWSKNVSVKSDMEQLIRLGLKLFDREWFKNNEVNIAISLPANFLENGYIVKWPNRKSWEGINLINLLSPVLGEKIILEDDANTALVAEMEFGELESIKNALFVSIGTGIGSGLIINGQVYKGNRGCAGELGHVIIHPDSQTICKCGKQGCLQPLASGNFLEEEAKKAGMDDVEELIRLGNNKDEKAERILRNSARRIAIAIANVAFYLDVEKVVVTGRFCKESSLWWNELKNEYQHNVFSDERTIPIKESKMINVGGLVGAAIVACKCWKPGKEYQNDILSLICMLAKV